MKKKQYASMQEELAARKAAAGYTEEPRARRNAEETDGRGRDSVSRGRSSISYRKSVMQFCIGLAAALVVLGFSWAFLIPDHGTPTGSEYPFDATATDEEIIEYIDERWSIDPQDSRRKIRLLSWKYHNQEELDKWYVGDWTMDVSGNFVIIRTVWPEDADRDQYYNGCKNAVIILQQTLEDEDLGNVPVALIARDPDNGELILVVINSGDYYLRMHD